MSRRLFNHKMLDEADISTNQTSAKTITDGVDQASILVTWSGTSPVGVITIEASNSTENDFNKNQETWYTVDFGSAINVSGNSGTHQINFTALPFRTIRFVYTSTSGTGTLTAHIQGSSIGA